MMSNVNPQVEKVKAAMIQLLGEMGYTNVEYQKSYALPFGKECHEFKGNADDVMSIQVIESDDKFEVMDREVDSEQWVTQANWKKCLCCLKPFTKSMFMGLCSANCFLNMEKLQQAFEAVANMEPPMEPSEIAKQQKAEIDASLKPAPRYVAVCPKCNTQSVKTYSTPGRVKRNPLYLQHERQGCPVEIRPIPLVSVQFSKGVH